MPGDLNIRVGADISDLDKAMNAAGGSTERFASRAKKALAGTTGSFNNLNKSSNSAAFALTNLGRVAQDLPFGFVGIQNNLNPLLESFQRLKAESGSTGKALKALAGSLVGAGGIGLALSVASTAILLFQNGMANFSKKTSAATDEIAKANEKLADSYKSIIADAAQEASRVAVIVEQLKQELLTRKQRAAAIEELKRISPEYFSLLNTEKATIAEITASYNLYAASIVRAITAKIREKQLEDVTGKILDLQKKQVDFTKKEVDESGKLVEVKNKLYDAEQTGESEYQKFAKGRGNLTKAQNTELKNLLLTQKALIEEQAKSGGKDFKISGDGKEKIKKAAKEDAIEYTETLQHALTELFAKGFQGAPDPFADLVKGSKGKIKVAFDPSVVAQLEAIKKKTEEAAAAAALLHEEYEQTSKFVEGVLGPAFDAMFTSIVEGSGNAFQSFGEALGKMVKQMVVAIAKAAILAGILSLLPGSPQFGTIFFKMIGFAEGGHVKGRGSGTSDSIPARLSAGEYVLKASTVKRIGVSNLDLLNQGKAPNFFNTIPKFAMGGLVSPSMGSIGGGISIEVFGKIEARGDKLVTIFDRAQKQIGRNS